ncbi:MAG: DUF3995 domain-containing protein [Solirubrobacteraceae bacterium]
MPKISNVHVREIMAPAAVVGELLDTLGSADDRVWATDIWVAEPVVFDRPLRVGADGGHGSIRYSVIEYEPGRRIVFEFSPDGGLSGTHGFELEALARDQCRLTHFLEAETSRWMRPIVPILIGWHDAMVETAFDRAELGATGSLEQRTRIPRWLRIVNGTEIALDRALGKFPPDAGRDPGRLPLGYRMSRPAGIVVPAALGAIAAIHAAWALGWRWPGGTDEALAERVVGAGAELPSEPVVWAVAAVLGAAAAVVAAVGAGRRERFLRAAAWSVAGVLIARGALYIPVDLIGGLDSIYAQLDLALYSPLCVALGLGTAMVARGPRPVQKRQTAWSAEPHGQVA